VPAAQIRCATPASPEDRFARRARLYGQLDRRLEGYTRFFAAAALTNSVLAELCAFRARQLWLSGQTISALLALGGILERVNVDRARSIEGEGMAPQSLDESYIQMEQSTVEATMRDWSLTSTSRYQQLITELDRVLRAVGAGVVPFRSSVSIRLYADVLRAVTIASGRSLSFARCDDRINIGKALVQSARRREF
jgi:hypothetical protein